MRESISRGFVSERHAGAPPQKRIGGHLVRFPQFIECHSDVRLRFGGAAACRGCVVGRGWGC